LSVFRITIAEKHESARRSPERRADWELSQIENPHPAEGPDRLGATADVVMREAPEMAM
jgi:hypothetical protein